ncbi:MAG TPA: helix-turn-helix transcriptional regulator [Povalibacter sp.]|nr:helix-turn-helix transcriptional regulator [Povalibacter sp.]
MKQTQAIHFALKRLLRSRGRTYAQAAKILKLSEASVKRLLSRSELSLDRLESLCDWLGVDIGDLVAMSADATPLLTELDERQEQELLHDPALLLMAFLTLNRWSESEILQIFNFRKVDVTQRLRRLERLGLVELMPFDRVRIRAARNFAWRKDGPIQKYFAERVLPEFLATRFDQPGEQMQFVGGMMSRASILKMHELMEALARQLDDLVAQDLSLPVEQRYGVSLFMGLRPWEFSEFTRLRRGPREKFFL